MYSNATQSMHIGDPENRKHILQRHLDPFGPAVFMVDPYSPKSVLFADSTSRSRVVAAGMGCKS